MKHFYVFSLFGLLTIFSGCNIINPAEPVPSYMHIEQISVTTDPTVEGSNSSKITDAWVYMDGSLIGCFELPVTFPIIGEGVHTFTIKAGIKVNGIAATRAPYPFYDNFVQQVTLTRTQVSTIRPVVHYTGVNWSSTEIFKDDFETGTQLLPSHYSGVDTTAFIVLNRSSHDHDADIFEGNGAGAAYLNNTTSTYAEVTTDELSLPGGESPVFMEMNYKCNYPFTIGVTAIAPGSITRASVINLHSTGGNWNKVYIYLTPGIAGTGNAPLYQVFIGMLNTDGAANPYFALDNVKILHY